MTGRLDGISTTLFTDISYARIGHASVTGTYDQFETADHSRNHMVALPGHAPQFWLMRLRPFVWSCLPHAHHTHAYIMDEPVAEDEVAVSGK